MKNMDETWEKTCWQNYIQRNILGDIFGSHANTES